MGRPTTIIRIANWTPRNIKPATPLSGLALKLLAIGAIKDPRAGTQLVEPQGSA